MLKKQKLKVKGGKRTPSNGNSKFRSDYRFFCEWGMVKVMKWLCMVPAWLNEPPDEKSGSTRSYFVFVNECFSPNVKTCAIKKNYLKITEQLFVTSYGGFPVMLRAREKRSLSSVPNGVHAWKKKEHKKTSVK